MPYVLATEYGGQGCAWVAKLLVGDTMSEEEVLQVFWCVHVLQEKCGAESNQ